LWQLPSVHEDLTIGQVFEDHHDFDRRLDDLYPAGRGDAAGTERLTSDGAGVILAKLCQGSMKSALAYG
jgi:hypothetical protein